MSGFALALSTIGVVLAVIVQLAALVWVLVKLRGRPRMFAAGGLGLLVLSTLFQTVWSRVAAALAPTDTTFVTLQAGWFVANLMGLVGIVLLVAGVAVGRARPAQPYGQMPTPGFGTQNQMYGPGNIPPAM